MNTSINSTRSPLREIDEAENRLHRFFFGGFPTDGSGGSTAWRRRLVTGGYISEDDRGYPRS